MISIKDLSSITVISGPRNCSYAAISFLGPEIAVMLKRSFMSFGTFSRGGWVGWVAEIKSTAKLSLD